ncbi:MAG: alpha/beta fold hydrolase [Solirubrobacteraceae bacterium]|nr:alpha/beta fold hydrolase [Patulibacter sp.]
MAAPSTLINYHRQGSGTPIVLIHGIAGSWKHWKPIIPALASRHDVIAIDLPGFGESVHLGIPEPSLEHFAQSILDLLDSLGIEKFHVAGNSLGGAVSVQLLGSGRVLSFHGISPAGQTFGWYLSLTKVNLRAAVYGSRVIWPIAPLLVKLRPLRMFFAAAMVGKPQRLTAPYVLDLIEGCVVGTNFEQTLAHAISGTDGLAVPPNDAAGQFLWGTRDTVLPLSAAGRYAKAWPAAEIIPMKGLGHVPMQDDPKLIADLILKLTGKVDAGAAIAATRSVAN